MTTIEILRGDQMLTSVSAEHEAPLLYKGVFEQGAAIRFTTDYEYAVVQVRPYLRCMSICR